MPVSRFMKSALDVKLAAMVQVSEDVAENVTSDSTTSLQQLASYATYGKLPLMLNSCLGPVLC